VFGFDLLLDQGGKGLPFLDPKARCQAVAEKENRSGVHTIGKEEREQEQDQVTEIPHARAVSFA
jgi:hypothetical protein